MLTPTELERHLCAGRLLSITQEIVHLSDVAPYLPIRARSDDRDRAMCATVNRDPVQRRREVAIAAAVIASWLGADLLTIHLHLPVVVNMALLLGVPFLWGVQAPASWRSKVGVLFVPLVLLCWLILSPWSGTSDTPPGWGIIRMTLEGAIFISGAQYLAFRLGVLRWTFTRRDGSRFT